MTSPCPREPAITHAYTYKTPLAPGPLRPAS
jgi:hypothetical protein